jgi:cytochrome c oxidase assembly protein subunit 15
MATIAAGGLVAGLHAGLIDNSFPLMEGQIVPPDFGELHPFVRNLTENRATVQFDHRLLATLTALSALSTGLLGLRLASGIYARRALRVLVGCVVVQYTLGVATLINAVPLALAVVHQSMAVLLLTAGIVVAHSLRGAVASRRATSGLAAFQEP